MKIEDPAQTKNESMVESGTLVRFLSREAELRHLKLWNSLAVEEEGVEVFHWQNFPVCTSLKIGSGRSCIPSCSHCAGGDVRGGAFRSS